MRCGMAGVSLPFILSLSPYYSAKCRYKYTVRRLLVQAAGTTFTTYTTGREWVTGRGSTPPPRPGDPTPHAGKPVSQFGVVAA